MVALPDSLDSKKYDLSFMLTRRCNLSCSFCMYECGPKVNDYLNLALLEDWLTTVDIKKITSFGIYGGEPSLNLPGYRKILDMISVFNKPQFIITNGSWSTSVKHTMEFINFCTEYKLYIVVSGTSEHRKYQNRDILELLKEESPDGIKLKPEAEKFHPMGRLANKIPMDCKQKCMTWNQALRIAVKPDGQVIYQNCFGVYPIVGNINEDFICLDNRVQKIRLKGFSSVCSYYKTNIDEN